VRASCDTSQHEWKKDGVIFPRDKPVIKIIGPLLIFVACRSRCSYRAILKTILSDHPIVKSHKHLGDQPGKKHRGRC